MRKYLDSFAWGFLLLFSIPSVGIVASWNSLPGDPLFFIKLGSEKTLAFIVSPNQDVSTQLQLKYSERRFADATQLIKQKQSVVGLSYLTKQVEETKVAVIKSDSKTDQIQLTETYIATLKSVNAELEQEKYDVLAKGTTSREVAVVPTIYVLPKRSVGVERPTPTSVAPASAAIAGDTKVPANPANPVIPPLVTTVKTVAPGPAVIAREIGEAQREIHDTITELEMRKAERDKRKKEERDKEQRDEEKKREERESRRERR